MRKGEYVETTKKTSNGLGITALVLGIIAFCLGWTGILGLILAISALVFGILTLVKKQNKGMGIAGIVLGSIALVTALVVTAITLALIGGVAEEADKADKKKNSSSEQRQPEKPKLDIAAFYAKVENGMTKEQVVELAAKDPGTCTESETQGLGKYEYCSWYGELGDSSVASVTFKDGAVESKTKTGF